MMWYYGWDWFFGGGVFMLLFMALFWALIIAGVVWFIRYIANSAPDGGMHASTHSNSSGQASALDILKERYAKGEIDKSEFEAKKKDIQE